MYGGEDVERCCTKTRFGAHDWADFLCCIKLKS